jgi:hypothetical protein
MRFLWRAGFPADAIRRTRPCGHVTALGSVHDEPRLNAASLSIGDVLNVYIAYVP